MIRARYIAFIFVCLGTFVYAQSSPNPIGGGSNTANHSVTGTPPQVAQPPAGATQNVPPAGKFCLNDARVEVKFFCPWLNDLMEKVKGDLSKGMSVDGIKQDANLDNDLQLLDPATEKGGAIIDDIIVVPLIQNSLVSNAQSVLQAVSQMNTSQQLGATNSVSGTTSLISKAGSAALLNLAIDSGTLTQSVNGATSTLTANTDEIYGIITGSPEYDFTAKQHAFEVYVLNPLSLTATFAIAQTSSTTAPAAGQASGTTPTTVPSVAIPTGAGKLTSITAKYQIPNKFDPRSNKFKAAWINQRPTLKPLEIAAGTAGINLLEALEKDATFLGFVQGTTPNHCQADLLVDAQKQDSTQLMKDFDTVCWQAELGTALTLPAIQAAANAYAGAQATLRTAYKTAILDAAGTMFSGQYTFNKPLNQPATHDMTLIFAYDFGTRGTITVNGAASIYNGALPAGANHGRVHYGQASGEYDRNLNNPSNAYQTQLSLAGYWQYQPQPSILNIPAGTVAPGTTIPLPNGTQEFVGTAGSLWVTQLKITIKGPDGVNIPVGVSWSNKTDLLQGNKIGAQVGLSYNFSTLSGLF